MELGEYLRALITADSDLEKTDKWGFRDALMRSFRRRHIFPHHVQFMTEDAVRWQSPQTPVRIPGLAFSELRFDGDSATILNYDVRVLGEALDGGDIVVRMDYGHALEQVVSSGGVAFEVDHVDFGYHTAWSVVAHGRAEEVTAPAEVARLRLFPLQPWAPGDRGRYVRIIPAAFTGRRIT